MSDDIATMKALQAGLNAAFETLFSATDAKSVAIAKEQLTALGHATAGTALGPAVSLMGLSGTVSGRHR
jgi:hypothetical protein